MILYVEYNTAIYSQIELDKLSTIEKYLVFEDNIEQKNKNKKGSI